MLDELLKRLPAEATQEREIVTVALRLPEALKAKADAIRGDADLTPDAKARKVKELALGTPLSHLKQLRDRAASMSADVEYLRLAMKPKAPDRSDLYGQAERYKLLDLIRAMPEAERFRQCMEDPIFSEAVLTGPHRLSSGLSTEQFELVEKAHVERLHGPQVAGLEKRAAIIEVVTSAMEIAESMFCRESGLKADELK